MFVSKALDINTCPWEPQLSKTISAYTDSHTQLVYVILHPSSPRFSFICPVSGPPE
uniref:Uncharacterized protein n=1 Tax=Arion vulgaris TaxID=1028688 RepID=A0A0B6YV63_9EUPU